MDYYINLFSGWGSGWSMADQFRENPALLEQHGKGEIDVSILPRINMGVGSIYSGYKEQINDEIDEMIAGVKSDSISLSYPESEIRAGQSGGIRDLTIQIPTGKRGSWGISFWRPFSLGLELTGNSLLLTMHSDAGLGKDEEETRIVLNTDYRLDIDLGLSQTRLGYGWEFENGIKLGVGMDVLYLELRGDGYSKTEGYIRQYGGDTDITQEFNDPVDGANYRNTLDNNWEAGYKEMLTGFAGGISYQISEKAMIDLGISQAYQQELSGSSKFIFHHLGSVDYETLTGDGEGELFDETQLELSKMTYTNEEIHESESLVFSYPGIIRLGLKLKGNKSLYQFVMAMYPGELSFRYKGNVRENGREKIDNHFASYETETEVDYTYGVKIKSKLEFNYQYSFCKKFGMFLSLQYYNLSEEMDNLRDEEGNLQEPEEMIGLAGGNIGINYIFSERFETECVLGGFPGPFMETKLCYRFGGK